MSQNFFEWKQDLYDIRVAAMNQEHQVLVRIMNDLFRKNSEGAPRAELKKTIQELAEFTVKHFQHEEAYFDSLGYPEAELHKAVHQDLLKKFGTHVEAFERGDGKVSSAFFDFLKMWLSAHIQHVDRKYGDHAAARRAA
jgi:hemerythrin-like metal-binding protein